MLIPQAERQLALAAYSSNSSRYFCAKSLGEPPGTNWTVDVSVDIFIIMYTI